MSTKPIRGQRRRGAPSLVLPGDPDGCGWIANPDRGGTVSDIIPTPEAAARAAGSLRSQRALFSLAPDEPAAALLERIAAEQATAKPTRLKKAVTADG
jgi:hypothetical protein